MRKVLLLSVVALTGCMNPHDPDAYTHCLIPSMCLDIAANRGNGPGFWGAYAGAVSSLNTQMYWQQQTLQGLQDNLAIIGAHSYTPTVNVHVLPY